MNHISHLPLIIGEFGASIALLVFHQDAQAGCVASSNKLTTTCSGTIQPRAL
ncbi:MAG: hypothetical protein PHF31_08600 [Methylobacter sp.]|nr:hypothetical protein [Methylobacter sp.]